MKPSIHEQVRAGYARIARQGGSCCATGRTATKLGYDTTDLAVLPEGADMGLSCGNPTALAALRSGEVVLDLGAGGGFDVFLAGRKVGRRGRVIGVDMTPEMVAKARCNIPASGLPNVEFRLGEIEHLPVADACVDVVISNCVINLSPDKPQVWREVARVLKPGGRVAVSDIALLKPLPATVRQSAAALVGCIAGAVLVRETRRMLRAAGLVDIGLTPKAAYVDSLPVGLAWPAGTKPGDFITSLDIAAKKPR